MNITVLGGTGRTGAHVLELATHRGMHVSVLTRRPQSLVRPVALDRVVEGDGMDPRAVRDAVTGAAAVVAILGARSRKGPHQVAAISRVLVPALTDAGVHRLVITSAYPLVARQPRVPLAILRLLLAGAYADLAAMEETVSGASQLDWTITRLNRLTNAPARGGTRISRDLLDKPSALTRADAAAALLDIACDSSFAGTAVNIAGSRPRRGRQSPVAPLRRPALLRAG